MKSLFSTLININIATAVVSLFVFAVMREHQTQLTDKQNLPEPVQSYHTAIRAKTTAEQAQLETSYQKIAQHEQQIEKLKGELEAYKTQVNGLLNDKNAQLLPPTQNANSPFGKNKNLTLSKAPAPSLLDRIFKSGQKNPSWQHLGGTVPSEPTFKASGASARTDDRNLSPIQVPENTSHQGKIRQSDPARIQATLATPLERTPSGHFAAPNQTIQASEPQLSGSEIMTDTRALFTDRSSQKPLDSFVTPASKDSDIRNRTASIAQQLARKANRVDDGTTAGQSDESKEHIAHANDIVAGLMVADEKGQINYGTKTYKKVQTAIRVLRRGENIDDAARRASLSPSVLRQLIKWGENRPGSLSELSEVSQASPHDK